MKELINSKNGKGLGIFVCEREQIIKGSVVIEEYLYKPQRTKGGRKSFGPGTAKNYNERVSKNGWNHYNNRANENGWNATGRAPK